MMRKFELPMERAAAAGRTDITTTDSAREALHVDPQEAHEREAEMGELAARLHAEGDRRLEVDNGPDYERGARAGLTAYRECYEFARFVANLDPDDNAADLELIGYAQAALEAAHG